MYNRRTTNPGGGGSLIEQVKKLLRAIFHENTMETIRYVVKKEDTCVISLIMFYESKVKTPKKCMGC